MHYIYIYINKRKNPNYRIYNLIVELNYIELKVLPTPCMTLLLNWRALNFCIGELKSVFVTPSAVSI